MPATHVATSFDFARNMWSALGGPAEALARLAFEGAGSLPSAFAVSDIAAASIACAALAVDELVGHVAPRASGSVAVTVDRRRASFWFATSLRPQGWSVPPLRDPLTGDYRVRDGWTRLHANAPRHREAAQRVLGGAASKDGAAAAAATWIGAELEQAIVAAGGCAAEMRDADVWSTHPQGAAVAAEPLIATDTYATPVAPAWPMPANRPLAGIRVLDMTRVLAGPVATRFLAGHGATVLRIDPPDWDEPGAVPDVTLGKHCARLDLHTSEGQATFAELLADADIFVHGLRPGALDALGFDAVTRRRMAPELIDVTLDAYGWHGPWAGRRGFDSLVQMSCGIASAGMRWRAAGTPVPLPVQALDHATGYLLAAAAIRGLTRRVAQRGAISARLSLARTAQLLLESGFKNESQDGVPLTAESADDLAPALEATPWGPARRIVAPWRIAGVDVRWDRAASLLGSAPARWPS